MRYFVKLFGVVGVSAVGLSFVAGPDWKRGEVEGGYILYRKSGNQIVEMKTYLNGQLVTHEYEDAGYRLHFLQYKDGELVNHHVQ